MPRAERIRNSEEAQEKYRVALRSYKSACATFAKIQISWKSIKNPTAIQRFVFLMAKEEFSIKCKEYATARSEWSASFIRENEQSLHSVMSLEHLLSQLPSGKYKDIEREASREQRLHEIESSPDLKAILDAAKKYTSGELKAPLEYSEQEATPTQEGVLVRTDNIDVFTQLEAEEERAEAERIEMRKILKAKKEAEESSINAFAAMHLKDLK